MPQFRYGTRTEECQEYSQDALRRNTGCWFPRTFIDGKGRGLLAVSVSGRSRRAAIRPYDQLFDLYAIGKTRSAQPHAASGCSPESLVHIAPFTPFLRLKPRGGFLSLRTRTLGAWRLSGGCLCP